MNGCAICEADRAELLQQNRPTADVASSKPFRMVDLFCGAGGLTVGALQGATAAGRKLEIPLAVEIDRSLGSLYRSNFPAAHVITGDIATLFDGEIGTHATKQESAVLVGDVDLLVAGPPCQGHSDLNNHTRRTDPKNLLYLRAVRAAELIRPKLLLIENVPGVRHDTASVVRRATDALRASGYDVLGGVVKFDELGIAQRRRRYVILASRDGEIDPAKLFDGLGVCPHERDLKWAIGDLVKVSPKVPVDTPAVSAPITKVRMQYLLDNGLYDLPDMMRPPCHRDKAHTYRSVYGRLRWNQPSQTITTGFSSMGQGRYMHPELPRTLTPREAARIQGFPDWYDWNSSKRTTVATAIGNAVPPVLTRRLISLIANRVTP